jgi:cysteine-rich repeat protein
MESLKILGFVIFVLTLVSFANAVEVDCGLRGMQTNNLVGFACEEGTSASDLKVKTDSGIYSVILVDITHDNASTFRINTVDGIKALKKYGQICGDAVVQDGEECDDGNTANNDSCLNNCSINVCGDGFAGPGEDCDGNDLAGQSCESLDYYGGELACTASCEFKEDRCFNPVCGNGELEATEECDNGTYNGDPCTPEYGGTCTYCDDSCNEVTVTGPYCGDGVVDAGEDCDGDDYFIESSECTEYNTRIYAYPNVTSCYDNCTPNFTGVEFVYECSLDCGQENACTSDEFCGEDYFCNASCSCEEEIGAGGCFKAGTKITLANGSYKNIEKIEEGDLVLAYNHSSNELVSTVVNNLLIHDNYRDSAVKLRLKNNYQLFVTLNHPFPNVDVVLKDNPLYDDGFYDYLRLEFFDVGDRLMYLNGIEEIRLSEITSIEPVDYFSTEYNLQLNPPNNFFANNILVHNLDCCGYGCCDCSCIHGTPYHKDPAAQE